MLTEYGNPCQTTFKTIKSLTEFSTVPLSTGTTPAVSPPFPSSPVVSLGNTYRRFNQTKKMINFRRSIPTIYPYVLNK